MDTLENQDVKRCTRCSVSKPFAEFPSNGGGKLRPECRDCQRRRVKRWRSENPDRDKEVQESYYKRNRELILARRRTPEERRKVAERARAKRAENASPRPAPLSPEQIRERRRLRYYANHEMELEKRRIRRQDPDYRVEASRRAREWRERHPERFVEARAKWRAENWDKVLDSNARRRAKLSTVVERFSRTDVYNRDGGICHLCEEHVDRDAFVIDHLIPLSKGGEHTRINVRVAHPRCNLRRGAGLLPAQLLLVDV